MVEVAPSVGTARLPQIKEADNPLFVREDVRQTEVAVGQHKRFRWTVRFQPRQQRFRRCKSACAVCFRLIRGVNGNAPSGDVCFRLLQDVVQHIGAGTARNVDIPEHLRRIRHPARQQRLIVQKRFIAEHPPAKARHQQIAHSTLHRLRQHLRHGQPPLQKPQHDALIRRISRVRLHFQHTVLIYHHLRARMPDVVLFSRMLGQKRLNRRWYHSPISLSAFSR